MAFRKEAFQAKVLQRLYPAAAPKVEKVRDSLDHNHEPDSSTKTTKPKQNKAAGNVGVCGLPAKKIYTVLLPPEDYKPTSGDEKLEAISSADRTAVDPSGSYNSDSAEDQDNVRRRRKRKKKRKADDARAGRTSSPLLGTTAQEQAEKAEKKNEQEVPEGQETISKSRKRKLKKKRQKEKLRSLGVVTKSRPLEFTYRRDGGNEEEEEDENEEENSQKVEDIVDFLRTTWDIYLSDRSILTADGPSLSLNMAESLFTCLLKGTVPPAAVSSLCKLRTLLGQRDVEQLNTALQEFSHTSTLSADETVLVHTLFNYWMMEVLPMQSQKAT